MRASEKHVAVSISRNLHGKKLDYNTPKIVLMLPILKTSAKSVQTTRVVSSNFSCSLYRLQLKSPLSLTQQLLLVNVVRYFSLLEDKRKKPRLNKISL